MSGSLGKWFLLTSSPISLCKSRANYGWKAIEILNTLEVVLWILTYFQAAFVQVSKIITLSIFNISRRFFWHYVTNGIIYQFALRIKNNLWLEGYGIYWNFIRHFWLRLILTSKLNSCHNYFLKFWFLCWDHSSSSVDFEESWIDWCLCLAFVNWIEVGFLIEFLFGHNMVIRNSKALISFLIGSKLLKIHRESKVWLSW